MLFKPTATLDVGDREFESPLLCGQKERFFKKINRIIKAALLSVEKGVPCTPRGAKRFGILQHEGPQAKLNDGGGSIPAPSLRAG